MNDNWFKSTFSNSQGNCLEVDGPFVKSTFSSGSGGTCVEVQHLSTDTINVRDSKQKDWSATASRDYPRPQLSYTRDEWQAFIDGVKAGEFDLVPVPVTV